MRIGPLGVLGLAAALTAGWAVGRLPTMLAEARQTPGAPATDARAVATAVPAAAPVPVAAQPIVVTMPAAAPPQIIVVHDGDGRPQQRDEPAEVRWTLPVNGTGAATAAATPVAAPPASPAPAAVVADRPADSTAFAVATLAYADLAVGNRRAAADKFTAALALDPAAPNAANWQKELNRLRRRWSGEGYTLLRGDGTPGLGTRPVLGGGQTAAQIAYTPMPLSRRPVYIVVRATTANSGGLTGTSGAAPSSQVAAGVKWQALPQLSISGERLFAVDHSGRSAWTVRLAGGAAHRFGPILADGYAEGGVVGFRRTDWFAGLQARAAYPFAIRRLRVEPGVGVWSGIQSTTGTTLTDRVDRIDLGPTFSLAWDKWNLRATADYRLKVAGNAQPGSGPVVTVSGAF